MRHTKIIATLGPASSDPATIDSLIAAGADMFRFNFSHGTHAEHAARFKMVRDAAVRAGRHIPVLQDLSGPKIRTGRLEGGKAIPLEPGKTLIIEIGDQVGRPGHVFTTYQPLATAVGSGDRLLLDDGHVELRVESATDRLITTTVMFGGALGEHKGINAPGVPLPAAGVTEKDARDLAFGLALGVDVVALSFVQSAADIVAARAAIAREGRPEVPIIAKLERPEAIDKLDEILAAADGVMVARGDLGPGDSAAARAAGPARRAAPRARARRADSAGDAGAGVDAHRVAADPRRGQRRGHRGDTERRRDHVVGRDGRGRASDPRRADARRDHRGGRVLRAGTRPAAGHRSITWPRSATPR